LKELRRDRINGDLVVFAKDRNKRPHDKTNQELDERESMSEYEADCPFCRGNEKCCDKSLFEIGKEGYWLSRAVPNLFPIIDEESTEIFGRHEVIIDTYRHNGSFYDMSKEEFKNLFDMYVNRYTALLSRVGTEYVSLFKNFLRKAGASLLHPHSQMISMSIIPPEVENELEIGRKYFEENGRSLYNDIIKEELEYGDRIVYEGQNFIMGVPRATKFSGEIRIMFKEKVKFQNLSDTDIEELAESFKCLFEKIYEVNGYMPFNVCVHTHPKCIDATEYFNAHIHILPRKFNFGGFELGGDIHVCTLEAEAYTKLMRW
jgi:UDPglucose--hexose-1-phosphate uridylyltransferase